MPTDASAANAAPSLSREQQAAALWTFVHLKVPRFTSQVALEVLSELPTGISDAKKLAKLVRQALAERGVAIKHQAALGAAARLLGHESWHAAQRHPAPAMFQLQDWTGGALVKESVTDWRALSERLCAALDSYLRREKRTSVLRVSVSRSSMAVLGPTDDPKPINSQPLLIVHPAVDGPHWREGLVPVLEHLRRALEETGRAFLDGIAVPRLCALQSSKVAPDWPGFTPDPAISSLVLKRFSTSVNRWVEIGRGGELACWSQLDLLLADEPAEAAIEEDGTWVVNEARHVWELQTLASEARKPVLELKPLPAAESRRLLRRYQLAKKVHPERLQTFGVTRHVEFLKNTLADVHIDPPRLQEAMRAAGLTWDTYLRETNQSIPLSASLPAAFLLGLLERIDVRHPETLLVAPPRSQLELVTQDSLLCSLLPNVSKVQHRFSTELSADIEARVTEALKDFETSVNLMFMQDIGGLGDMKGKELPYHVYSRAADKLRAKLDGYGLCMFVGVAQTLHRWSDSLRDQWKLSPYSLSFALFLDIDSSGAVSRPGQEG